MSKRIKKNRGHHDLPHPYKRTGNKIKFDPTLSLELDKATAALEAAEEAGDARRAEFASMWKARLEAQMP
jgi:hypothetical protein